MKSERYWALVRCRIEKQQNRIKISQLRERFADGILPPPGSPPFEYRPAFTVAGWRPVSEAEEAEARESSRRRKASRRVGIDVPIGDPIRPGPPYWEYPSPRDPSALAEYASAVYRLEAHELRLAKINGVWRQTRHEVFGDGFTVSSLPDGLMLTREDRELLARILDKSPGRNRGRPAIGERAMTAAERQRRSRAVIAPVPRGSQPGIVVPPPLGPAVPGTLYEEVAQMVTNLVNVELAEKYHQYLGEVLDRLMSAPPDYILSREEFTVVTAAAVLADRLLPKQLH